MRSKYYLIHIVAFAALQAVAGAQTLTLREAIDRALGQSPQATIAKADTDAASAAQKQARTGLLPQLSFIEDISRGNDPVYVFGERLRERQFTQANFALNALNRPSPIGNFSTRFSGQWMAFDSWKTEKEIHRTDLFAKSAGEAAKASDQQIVMRVVAAYQSVLFAQRTLEVAVHEQQTAEALVNDAAAHVKAGLAVDSDRMAAEVNAAARKQELIAARGALEIAWAELGAAMGASDLQPTELKPIEAKGFPESTLADEQALALKARSDLAAMGSARDAQIVAVSSARSDFGPRIAAYGNWEEDRGSLTSSGGNNWVAGVQISLDLMPFAKREQLKRESAARTRAEAQVKQAELDVRLQVNRAHIARKTAGQSLATAHAAMEQATESLRIVKNRYGAGLATITDLFRAEDAEREAQSNYWKAVYGNAMAYAQLLYAEGALSPATAEELE